MRHRPELMLILAMSVFAVTGLVAVAFDPARYVRPFSEPAIGTIDPAPAPLDAATWFSLVRGFCNSVEVDTHMQTHPAPPTPEGAMYQAACYALAGRIGRARQLIEGLAPGQRYEAAGVVFEVGHPAADAGDDVAAGPLMELVVEYWPNHYMALYHAGAARYETGDYEPARIYLQRFLVEYATEDGWRTNALAMLERIGEAG